MRYPFRLGRFNWSVFAAEAYRDLLFYGALLLTLSIARLVFIVAFRTHLAPATNAGTILTALLAGVRFDAKAAAATTLVLFISATLRAALFGGTTRRLRSAWAAVCIAGVVFLLLLRIEFYREFHDLYNEVLFITENEDWLAMWRTAAAANGLYMNLVLTAASGSAGYLVFRDWLYPLKGFYPCGKLWQAPALRVVLVLLLAAFFGVSFRGRVWGPIFKPRDAAVTADPFLNKAVLDDATTLRIAIQKRRKLAATSMHITAREVSAATQALFKVDPPAKLEDLALRHARGARIPKPRHIMVIVGESFASWPLLENYQKLGLAEGVLALGLEPESAIVRPFLPASSSTMTSIAAIVTGLLDVDLETNYRSQSKAPYATSIATQFQALGYTPRFYYGGFPSWQRLADFVRDQGFRQVYAAGDSGVKPGTWGVEDGSFFASVLRDFSDETPTFNLVLTVSNHSPFEADVAAAGIERDKFSLAQAALTGTKTTDALRAAHFAYADRAITGFIRAFRQRFPETLFVVTGDHAQRLMPLAQPTLYEERAVPFVISGPGVHPGLFPADAAGFHLSIAPTLIELIAPGGFVYSSWVPDMLTPGGIGFQRYVWIDANAIGRTDGDFVEPLPWASPPRNPVAGKPEGSTATYEALRTVSAWRILRGKSVP